MVVATQNPVEMAGTYPLAEGVTDRFMAAVSLGRADAAEEVDVLTGRRGRTQLSGVSQVASMATIADARAAVQTVHLAEAVARYVVDVLHATREHPRIRMAHSTAPGVSMVALARAFALMDGRDHVAPHDIAGPRGARWPTAWSCRATSTAPRPRWLPSAWRRCPHRAVEQRRGPRRGPGPWRERVCGHLVRRADDRLPHRRHRVAILLAIGLVAGSPVRWPAPSRCAAPRCWRCTPPRWPRPATSWCGRCTPPPSTRCTRSSAWTAARWPAAGWRRPHVAARAHAAPGVHHAATVTWASAGRLGMLWWRRRARSPSSRCAPARAGRVAGTGGARTRRGGRGACRYVCRARRRGRGAAVGATATR